MPIVLVIVKRCGRGRGTSGSGDSQLAAKCWWALYDVFTSLFKVLVEARTNSS